MSDPQRSHLFQQGSDGTSRIDGPALLKRGDRIEVRGEDGSSTVVVIKDIDDGPGGSFAMVVEELTDEA